ncbi:MAG: PKD domain-containing protein [Bacteroidota bacterium]
MRRISINYSLLLSIILLGFCSKVFAQEVLSIPPSPDASALGRYGETPAGLYSGIMPIGVPITGISGRSVSVGLGLNYFGGGQRVRDYGSWVGLNWTLQGAGVISRSVNGIDDYAGSGYRNATVKDITDLTKSCESESTDQTSWVRGVLDGNIDSAPDVFFFNFAGVSGKFIFEYGGGVKILSGSGLKIEAPNSPHEEWVITTTNGMKYYFGGGVDYTEYNNNVATSWYMKKVVSLLGEEANFTYTKHNYSYSLPDQLTAYYKIQSTDPENQCDQVFGANSPQNFSYNGLYLDKIILNDDEIEFVTGPRCDLKDAVKLEKIIYRHAGAVIKGYDFGYHCDEINSRLWLKTVTEFGKNESRNPPYRFSYYQEKSMPSPQSFAIDHWGFYNGAESNTHLIPVFNTMDTLYIPGANRDSHPDYGRYGSLDRIDFPTGGCQEYTYEINQYIPYRNQTYYKVQASPNIAVCLGGDCIEIDDQESFTLNKATLVEARYDLIKGLVPTGPGGPTLQQGHVRVQLSGNGIAPVVFQLTADGGSQGTYSQILPAGTYSITASMDDLPSDAIGNLAQLEISYNEIVVDTNPNHLTRGAGLRVAKIATYDGTGDNPPIIKRYEYQNPSTGLTSGILMTQPHYHYFTDFEVGNTDESCTYLVRTSSSTVALSASANGSFVGYAYVIEYEGEVSDPQQGRVIHEFYNAADEPGEGFNTCPELASNTLPEGPFPYVPSKVVELRKGFMKSQLVERSYQGQYYPVSSTSYNYEVNEYTEHLGWVITGIMRESQPNLCKYVEYAPSLYQSFRVQLSQTSTTSYDGRQDVVGESRTSTEYYTYRSESPWLLNETRTETNAGEENIVRLFYPQDYPTSAQNGVVGTMVDRNILQPVIERQVWRKEGALEKLLGSQVTEFFLTSNYVMPYKYYFTEFQNPQTSWTNYTGNGTPDPTYYDHRSTLTYDVQGNLVQTVSKGVPQAVIYGYDEYRTMAEVSNAFHNQIAYIGFEEPLHGNWEGVDEMAMSSGNAHTGKYAYHGSMSKTDLPEGTYSVALWAKGADGNVVVNGQSRNTSAEWERYRWILDIPSNGSINVLANSTNIDDVRLLPADATMTAYTYEPGIGVTAVSGNNNLPAYSTYDDMNRLVLSKDFEGNVVQRVRYQYKPFSGYINYDGTVALNGEEIFSFQSADEAFLQDVEIAWDFGDGTPTQYGMYVKHTYERLGFYNITLTIDGTQTFYQTIFVEGGLSADVNIDNNVLEQPVSLSVINALQNPVGTTYTWNSNIIVGDLNGTNISFDIARLGTYAVTLTVSHPFYSTYTTTIDVMIDGEMVANSYKSDQTRPQGYIMSFSAQEHPNPSDAQYQWDFGDGAVATGRNDIEHRFMQVGTFNVRLDVEHPDYTNVSDDFNVTTYYVDPVILQIQQSEISSDANSVTLDFNIDTELGRSPYTYQWQWKFNSDADWSNTMNSSSSNWSYTFQKNGPAKIKVWAIDADGRASQPLEVNLFIPFGN